MSRVYFPGEATNLAAHLDAGRYRWLRARVDGWSSEYDKSIVRVSQGYDYASTPKELDEQIDREMQLEKSK